MSDTESGQRWFARRNGAVRGPFTDDHVKRYILLGRIRVQDELSQDECHWQAVLEHPELLPEVMTGVSGPNDYQRYLEAYSEADERKGERRSHEGALPSSLPEERRRLPDRRSSESQRPTVQPRDSRSRVLGEAQPLRILLLATLVASLVLAYLGSVSE